MAIVEDGEVAWSQGFGEKARGGDAVASTTLFRAPALSFPATAIAVLQLVDAGLVDLDAPIIDYVPEFTVDDSPELVPLMTVRQLLTHSSGLQVGQFAPMSWPNDDESELDDYLTSGDFARQYRVLAPPGRLHQASFLGFALAGLIVERVSGQLYADYMSEHVLGPLGLNRTTFRPLEVEADGDFAYGRGVESPSSRDNPWLRPAIGAYSSIIEVARFAQFLLRGDETVLSETLRQEMISPQFDTQQESRVWTGYGIWTAEGWQADFWTFYAYEVQTVWTWAWLTDYGSQILLVPSRDFALVLLENKDSVVFADAPGLALRSVLGLPDIEPGLGGDPTDLGTYAGTFVDDWGDEVQLELREGVLHMSRPACDLEPVALRNFICRSDNDMITLLLDDLGVVDWLTGDYVVAHRVGGGL